MANYKNQVRLLLSVLPEVAKEKCFALHGGTAINLFIRIDIFVSLFPEIDDSNILIMAIKKIYEENNKNFRCDVLLYSNTI